MPIECFVNRFTRTVEKPQGDTGSLAWAISSPHARQFDEYLEFVCCHQEISQVYGFIFLETDFWNKLNELYGALRSPCLFSSFLVSSFYSCECLSLSYFDRRFSSGHQKSKVPCSCSMARITNLFCGTGNHFNGHPICFFFLSVLFCGHPTSTLPPRVRCLTLFFKVGNEFSSRSGFALATALLFVLLDTSNYYLWLTVIFGSVWLG